MLSFNLLTRKKHWWLMTAVILTMMAVCKIVLLLHFCWYFAVTKEFLKGDWRLLLELWRGVSTTLEWRLNYGIRNSLWAGRNYIFMPAKSFPIIQSNLMKRIRRREWTQEQCIDGCSSCGVDKLARTSTGAKVDSLGSCGCRRDGGWLGYQRRQLKMFKHQRPATASRSEL